MKIPKYVKEMLGREEVNNHRSTAKTPSNDKEENIMAIITINQNPANDIDIETAILDDQTFYDNFVFYGNSDLKTIEKAAWWDKAKTSLGVLDYYSFTDISDDTEEIAKKEGWDIDTAKKIIDIYKKCRRIDDVEAIVAVANILFPDRKFDHREIHGSVQREWQEIVYDTKYEHLVDAYEEYYFGQYVAIRYNDWNMVEYMRQSEYESLDSDDLHEVVRNIFGIDEDEEIFIEGIDKMEGSLLFEADDCNDPDWDKLFAVLKKHLPNFSVSYGEGNWMNVEWSE